MITLAASQIQNTDITNEVKERISWIQGAGGLFLYVRNLIRIAIRMPVDSTEIVRGSFMLNF